MLFVKIEKEIATLYNEHKTSIASYKFTKLKENLYKVEPTESTNINTEHITKFIITSKDNHVALKFLTLLYNDYTATLTIKYITDKLEIDKIIARPLIYNAEKLNIIKRYGTYWKVPKKVVTDIYHYQQTNKLSPTKGGRDG